MGCSVGAMDTRAIPGKAEREGIRVFGDSVDSDGSDERGLTIKRLAEG